MARSKHWTLWRVIWTCAVLATGSVGQQILQTSGFDDCGSDTTIKVDKLDISYNNDNKTVIFDVVGSSSKRQNVTATLTVTAYGNTVFTKKFNPCDSGTFVNQLCPLPVGTFAARGSQQIPPQFASMVPDIAFKIPDILAMATLELNSLSGGSKVACIQSQVSNGKTVDTPVVSYVAGGIAGAALIISGVSAASAALSAGGAAASGAGVGGVSPSFVQVAGWFQGMAMNGMLSVNYPPIYRNFAKNFAFSTGLVPWNGLLSVIDNFRAKTGGNLTNDSVEFLRNATLKFPDGSTSKPARPFFLAKRTSELFIELAERQIDTSINTTSPDQGNSGIQGDIKHAVSGIRAFAEQLSVPKSDIFMTALLIVAIVIGAIVVGILLVKGMLELWALFGSFPQALAGFREHHWGSIARTITSLILLLYGVWVLYCVFQFTLGDSWAAKVLAGVTLGLFTSILFFFAFKIWSTARRLKAEDGDTSRLYEDKSIWVKYSMFYDAYRQNYWWLFIPFIIYMIIKGCVLAAADGHGMVQTIAMLVIEAIFLGLLLWSRPYERRSGNIINIAIQVVRVLSVACILVFVEEFGISQTTQTVTGVVLIAIQSTLTAILAILIIWNVISTCVKMNPHRKRRKEMEKMRDMDTLTPLDARNSLLLLNRPKNTEAAMYSIPTERADTQRPPSFSNQAERYYPLTDVYRPSRAPSTATSRGPLNRALTPAVGNRGFTPATSVSNEASQNLVQGAAPVSMGGHRANHSRDSSMGQEYDMREYIRPQEFVRPQEYGRGYQQPYGYSYSNAGYRGF